MSWYLAGKIVGILSTLLILLCTICFLIQLATLIGLTGLGWWGLIFFGTSILTCLSSIVNNTQALKE